MATIIPILDLTAGTVKGSDVYPAVDVTDTTQASDGTTKKYSISQLMDFFLTSLGFTVYESVEAASTAALTVTYTNGTAGVGRKLTNAGTQTAFSLDGQAGVLNTRYLIKNQADAAQNGIYTLTTVGNGTTNWILTGASDFNSTSNIVDSGIVFVNDGTVNNDTFWEVNFSSPLVVGTTLLVWSAFNLDPNIVFSWNVVSGTTQAISNQNGYITSNGSLTTFTLPVTSNVGQIFRIAGYGTGGWKLEQNAAQSIAIGSSTTSTGILGNLQSTNARDSIEVVCIAANTTYLVLNMMGNLTVV